MSERCVKFSQYSSHQAGFDAGDGISYTNLPGSLTDDVLNLKIESNVGVPGRWLYIVNNHNGEMCFQGVSMIVKVFYKIENIKP